MPDAPKYIKLLPGEETTRKSKGLGISAILWFDEGGKIYTKKPMQWGRILDEPKADF